MIHSELQVKSARLRVMILLASERCTLSET